MNYFIRVLLIYFAVVTTSVHSDYGLIHVYPDQDHQGSVVDQPLCMMYNPYFHRIPKSIQSAIRLKIADFTPNDGCSDIYNTSISLSGCAVAVIRGDCMFVEKALLIQEYNGSVALIVSNTSLITPGVNQTSDYDEINITVAVILDSDFQKLQLLGASVQIALYAPEPPSADINMIIIFFIALTCIMIGGYWSGISRQAIYEKKKMRKPSEDKDDEEPESLDISPIFILVFVLLLCGMIVAMYFFYSVLVYVVIVLFSIGSALGLHCCLLPLWRRVMTFRSRFTCCKQVLYVRDLILFALCVAVVVAWAVMRNANFAWIVQDLLGMAFCINFMVIVRLPNLMICTIMLLLLFCYDIFFVFITPLFTSSGESIMIQVATGGGTSKEELPIVFKLPHLTPSPYSVCSLPFSLLGFGDVLVPGFLVSFNYGMDLRFKAKNVYFIGSIIAYGVGMACTYAALIFMKTGQPALLYLVPCTLLTTAAIGWKRKELKMLWKGKTAEELLQKNDPGKNTISDSEPDTKDGPINKGDNETDENQKLL